MNKKYHKKSFQYVLFIVAILLMPFDNLPYLNNIFGELSYKAAFYPFLLAIILFLCENFYFKRIYVINNLGFKILISFFTWAFISSIINYNSIWQREFKGRTGNNKFILQLMVLVFAIILVNFLYYLIRNNKITLKVIRRYIIFSFFIAGFYSLFEIFYIIGFHGSENFLTTISYYIQSYYRGQLYLKRIRSVCGEASYFSMYASFIFPWILSYVFENRKQKFKYIIILLYFIMLVLLSKSRIGYIIILIQFLFFYYKILKIKGRNKNKFLSIICLALILIIISFVNKNIYSKTEMRNTFNSISIESIYNSITDSNNMSNVARFGLQEAGIRMGMANPIFGVGLGQYGFNVVEYISSDALRSSEVQSWISSDINSPWAPAFSLFSRIFAENGIIGLMLWIGIWGYTFFRCLRVYNRDTDNVLGLTVIVTIIGVFLAGFNADTYAYIEYWITLAISWNYIAGNSI